MGKSVGTLPLCGSQEQQHYCFGERRGASPEIRHSFHCAEYVRYQDMLKCPLKKEVWKEPCLSHILVLVGMMARFIHFLKNNIPIFLNEILKSGQMTLPVNTTKNNT